MPDYLLPFSPFTSGTEGCDCQVQLQPLKQLSFTEYCEPSISSVFTGNHILDRISLVHEGFPHKQAKYFSGWSCLNIQHFHFGLY